MLVKSGFTIYCHETKLPTLKFFLNSVLSAAVIALPSVKKLQLVNVVSNNCVFALTPVFDSLAEINRFLSNNISIYMAFSERSKVEPGCVLEVFW